MKASRSGQVDVVQALFGAELNSKDEYGETALMHALETDTRAIR